MPFTLQNTLSIFQRTVYVILFSVEWQFALVYLDEIMIFRATPEQQFNHVRKIHLLLYNARATLMFKKCSFVTKTIDYMYHISRPRRPELASHTKDATYGLKPQASLSSWGLFKDYAPFLDDSRPTLPESRLLWSNGWREHFQNICTD